MCDLFYIIILNISILFHLKAYVVSTKLRNLTTEVIACTRIHHSIFLKNITI